MTDEELAEGWVTDNTGFNPKEPLGKIAIRTFLGGLKAGRPKWHKVADGDLPKKENLECLCIIRPAKEEGESFENKDFRGVLYFRNGRFYLDEDNSNDCLKETNSDFTDLVIAWKEIVLPKEIKQK